MNVLWIVAGVLTLVTLGALIYPLTRRASGKGASIARERAEFDITVYKDQLLEVDRDLERGMLSDDQAVSARTEIERRMLGALDENQTLSDDASDKNKADAAHRHPLTAALLVGVLVLVPLGAFGLYMQLGQPQLKDQPLAARELQKRQNSEGRSEIVDMIKNLEKRMADQPDDPNGWALLGRGYQTMGRLTDAIAAYQRLVDLTERDVEALVLLGEVVIENDRGAVSQQALELMGEAKAADPEDPRPYFYIGLERQQKDDIRGAIDEWVALLNHSPSNAQWVGEIRSRIEAVATEASITVPTIKLLPPVAQQSVPQQSTPQSGAPGPTQQQMQDAGQMNDADRNVMIRTMVERLATQMKDNPDNVEGWTRLERAYQVLGETAKAADARANVERLQGK